MAASVKHVLEPAQIKGLVRDIALLEGHRITHTFM